MSLILFTKPMCTQCDEAKAVIADRGLKVEFVQGQDPLHPDDGAEAAFLGQIAWYEGSDLAESEGLPILVQVGPTGEAAHMAAADEAIRYLKGITT